MTYEFADRLIELRKDNGMSQEELAQRIGLSRQAVSKWERAESSPDIGNLVALAEIYGLTIDDIVKGTSAVSSEADEDASSKAEAAGEESVEEVIDDEPEVLEDVEVDFSADSADAQPRHSVDDVSKMPPPDPSQRVDWADAAVAWQPPEPRHRRRGIPSAVTRAHPTQRSLSHRPTPRHSISPLSTRRCRPQASRTSRRH